METTAKELETGNDNEPVMDPETKDANVFEPSSAELPTISVSNPKFDTNTGSSKEVAVLGSKGETTDPTLKIEDQGNKTITMRELLTELKNEGNDGDNHSSTPPSARGSQQHQSQLEQNHATMELINSVNTADDEGRSRQRILTYAAKRYASAIERNPGDYDALYNWALVLQESADNVSSESISPSKDALLQEACRKYDEATHLNPQLHDAFYNWAIAISDRAKLRGRTMEAENLWKEATLNYEKAVKLNWNSPQALNNWGLALQELSAIVPARDKQEIVKTAISKFRAAITLQFDFHRAIYNLGTVLYGLAEDTMRSGKSTIDNDFYSQSALYIAAAHSLKPNYSVYSSALKLVRSMLPLPFLKVGSLTVPPSGNALAPHGEWKRSEFLLNHEGLKQAIKDEGSEKKAIKVDVADIVSLAACGDLTLPRGPALALDTVNGPLYLIADTWESLEGWLDAVRLVYTIFARGKTEVLAGILAN